MTTKERSRRRSATATSDTETLLERYRTVRRFSEALCGSLEPEDCVIQSMPDVSPTRWHLAHTTWFFETFVLERALPDYDPHHPAFKYLFNSYYNTVGEQFPRPRRGLLSRPTVRETLAYRTEIDHRMADWLASPEAGTRQDLLRAVEIGLHHEQQHQELILTDIKHVLSCNPLHPVFRPRPAEEARRPPPLGWVERDPGLVWIGHQGDGFAFDNELPRHRRFLETFQLATRLSTNGEYVQFIEDGGYRRPELWLSAGWQEVCARRWTAPLYWEKRGGDWWSFTLAGLRPVAVAEPVCHVSYYEADAFARWSGSRLATEGEWEISARETPVGGNFVETGLLHPAAARDEATSAPRQFFGDVWEWTSSSYSPYPGYAPPSGALGEYNGKFMCNQFVLRGGSCATPRTHIRETYRNFFPPEARWQFSGIRLARASTAQGPRS